MRLLLCTIAAVVSLGGCASAGSPAGFSQSGAKAAQEDYVLGSRLRRSELNENYQGAKSVTRQDYQEYKASTSLKGGD